MASLASLPMLSAPSRIPAHDSKVASRPRQAPTAAVGDDVDQRLLPEHDPHRDIGVGPSSQPGDDERALRLRTREGLVAKRGITGVAAVAAMLNVICSGLAYSVGGISWLEHAVVIVPTMYFMCICIHDGCHFMLTPYRWLTDLLGFCLSLFLAIPFPLLRASHLTHHKHFGTELEPESVVYGATLWQLPFRLLRVPAYYFRAWTQLSTAQKLISVFHLGCVVSIYAVVGEPMLLGLVVPALLTIAWFGATTVYVPHAPGARPLMRFLTGHSGYHDEHHRNVAVPYNQYWELRRRDIAAGLSTENYPGEAAMLTVLNAPISQVPAILSGLSRRAFSA
jgi:fatty acid desaturase